MPQFRFRAFDNSGASSEGDIHATTAHEAVRQLAQKGLKVQSIVAAEAAPPPVAPKPVQAALPPQQQPKPVAPAPIARPKTVETPTPVRMYAATPSPPMTPVRTKPSSYTDLFFIFSQLARLIQSGITTSEALQQLAVRERNPERQQAFRHMAALTSEGASLADAMAIYDDLFPPGVVGAVRAGENGGYLWQACESISEQQQNSASIRKVYWWVNSLVLSSIIMLPATVAINQGLDYSFKTMSGLPGLITGTGKALLGPMGWILALILIAYYIGKWHFAKTEQRALRHRVGFYTPILGKRAIQENLRFFTWHLGNLSKAGISPMSSWQLASRAVPNLEYAKIVEENSQSMTESSKLSQLLYSSKMVPREYADLIETGEMTGSLPQALDQAADLSKQDVAATEQFLKWKMGCWGMLVMVGVSVLAYALFARGYIDSLFKNILEDL